MPKPDEALQRARDRWRYRGRVRPDFAHEVGPGQESVWDYPRPPRVEAEPRTVRVLAGGGIVAESAGALRVLETASPPTVYVPRVDVRSECLVAADPARNSLCEWKGKARSWCLASLGPSSAPVAWSYPEPFDEYRALSTHLAFYPARVECWLGGERVCPQPGGFYGGWVSAELAGPFKGDPGTEGW